MSLALLCEALAEVIISGCGCARAKRKKRPPSPPPSAAAPISAVRFSASPRPSSSSAEVAEAEVVVVTSQPPSPVPMPKEDRREDAVDRLTEELRRDSLISLRTVRRYRRWSPNLGIFMFTTRQLL